MGVWNAWVCGMHGFTVQYEKKCIFYFDTSSILILFFVSIFYFVNIAHVNYANTPGVWETLSLSLSLKALALDKLTGIFKLSFLVCILSLVDLY